MEALWRPAGEAISLLVQSLAYGGMLSMPLMLLFALHDAAEEVQAHLILRAILRALIALFFPFAFVAVYGESGSLLTGICAPGGAFFIALHLLARLPTFPTKT